MVLLQTILVGTPAAPSPMSSKTGTTWYLRDCHTVSSMIQVSRPMSWRQDGLEFLENARELIHDPGVVGKFKNTLLSHFEGNACDGRLPHIASSIEGVASRIGVATRA